MPTWVGANVFALLHYGLQAKKGSLAAAVVWKWVLLIVAENRVSNLLDEPQAATMEDDTTM